ncbi:DMT family transporter [Butyricicoccus sp. 1XD8-22]|nr:DMT family transporter [Butyricicoccus sp. 1XD8-22]
MNRKTRAVAMVLCSAFCFALMNLFVRLSGDLPSVQKSFFRNAIAFLFALLVLLRQGGGVHFRKSDLPLLLVRSAFGTVGILCNFYAVDHLVLSDASMLNKLSPFFAIIFSFFFLHERAKPVQVAALVTAFAGALCIIKPSFGLSEAFPSLIGMLGGMGAGAAYTAVRALGGRGVKGPLIVLFFSGFSSLCVLPWLLFDFHPMQIGQLVCLLGAGLAAAGGQFSITAAYSLAPAKEISIYDYSQVIFSAVLGFFFFGQLPDGLSVLGYLIICGASAWMFLWSRRVEQI